MNDHNFCVKSSYDVSEICRPFLKKNALTFFSFIRFFYTEKKFSVLSTHYKLQQYHLNNPYPVTLPTDFIENFFKYKMFYFVDADSQHQTIMNAYNKLFDIGNMMGIFKKYAYYADFFFFAGKPDQTDRINYYLNNLDVLENFTQCFEDKGKSLIALSQKDKITINKERLDFLINFIFKNSPAFSLTNREKECIHHIILGKSAKEIGKALKISYKTVEFHIANIKEKIGCNRKSQMIEIFLKAELPIDASEKRLRKQSRDKKPSIERR